MKRPGLLVLTVSTFAGCAYPMKRTGIVHDYVIDHALVTCQNHSGLHYIVSDQTIFEKGQKLGHSYDFPCRDVYKFRCQDGSIFTFDDGVDYCFISESQLNETLEKK